MDYAEGWEADVAWIFPESDPECYVIPRFSQREFESFSQIAEKSNGIQNPLANYTVGLDAIMDPTLHFVNRSGT